MATVSWGAEYTVTSSAPGIVGKATYSIDAYGNATITMTMHAISKGAWANDPWCAWVNGVSKDTKPKTSGTIGRKEYYASFPVGTAYTGTLQWSGFNRNNRTTQYNYSIPTGSFNLNILNPDGSEPYTTGEAGTVEFSDNSGNSYTRVSNEPASSYVQGRGFRCRNFTPGTGKKFSYTSGFAGGSGTSGDPWYATQGDSTTLNIYTAWQTYTVTLDQQGGSGGTTSVNITYNTAQGDYPSITLPTRSGYTFGGYYTSTGGRGTQYYNSSGNSVRTFQIASNTTWYAYWIPNNYTLTINPNGGKYNNSTGNTVVTQAFNTTYTLGYPTREGYLFSHWSASRRSDFDEYGAKCSTYNNSQNGTVVLTWLQSESTSGTNGDVLRIVTNGSATPGAGGFYQAFQTEASHVYLQIYRLKVPVGYTVSYANNAMGNGATVEKWTTMEGTGNWKTYVFKMTAGSSGNFSTSGFIYLNGSNNTSVTWYMAQAQVWDVTAGSYKANSNGIYRFDYAASNCTLTANWIPINNMYVNVNGTWKGGLVFVNVNGVWKQAEAVYVNVNGTWKQTTG